MNPADFDTSLPLSRARTIPASWYFDPAAYRIERERVFAGSWQMVGRLAQVSGPGDYFTCELADEPILVVRDNDDTLRAFYNVCRHRAAPLLTAPCGHVTKLRCRYHGWTYDLAGKLRGVPEFDGVEDFDREGFGLREIPLDTFGGLVWIHPGEVTQSLAEFLSPIPEWMRSRGSDLSQLHFVRRVSYDVNCNWKVYVDNYLDGGYHIRTVHPELAGVLDYSQYRTAVYPSTSLQSSPLTGGDADDAANRTRKGDLAAYWWVWPNFMLNLYDGIADTNLVLPLGPDRCRVVFDFYFREVEGESAGAFMNESIAVGHRIQTEDIEICEEVQKGLRSSSYSTGRFSVRREIAGHHFHRLLGERFASGKQSLL